MRALSGLIGLNPLRVGFMLMIVAVAAITLLATSPADEPAQEETEDQTIKVELGFDGEFPVKHTCRGRNLSPPVNFYEMPEKAETVAIIMEDPDATIPDFTHWLVWNLPVDENISQNMPDSPELENDTRQGTNDFDKIGYNGPCPPSGTHTYRLTAYALDTSLSLQPGASKTELRTAMEDHILTSDTVRHDFG